MEAKDFKVLAEELAKRGTPAACRTAISRAYYYAFNDSVRFVGRYFRIPQNAEGHGFLQRLLNDTGDADLQDVARQLGDLRSYRNEADYDLDKARPEGKTHATLCSGMATNVIVGLVAVIGESARWNEIVRAVNQNFPAYKLQSQT